MKHIASLLLLVAFATFGLTCIATAQRRGVDTGERHTFDHDGTERAYRLHVPADLDPDMPAPLLFCFHGGGGTAEVASRMGFTPLADKHNFIVVYPEGLNKHWNDGRKSKRFADQDATTDDVAFVLALLKTLQTEHKIDPQRIYATGASNGGFISQRLAIDAADTFAAVGIIIATMGKPLAEAKYFHPSQTVSVLYMNGTADPFVPYDGGPITPNLVPALTRRDKDYGRGECISTDDAVALWVKRNGLAVEPVVEMLPDKDSEDGCTVKKSTWRATDADTEGNATATTTEVVLYRVEGGGHTIPGGAQYLPERIIGKTCKDFDGVAAVWEFLSRHRLSELP